MDDVEIRRSTRRRKTVQAYRKDGKTIVQIPAHLTPAQERECVERLVARLDRREQRSRGDESDLMRRAQRLDATYFGGAAAPTEVRWVGNQNRRWGSASLHTRVIRLSDRMIAMPDWVVDYVLVHELAHLVEPADGHGPRFTALVARYPKAERAEGFLRGVDFAGGVAHSLESSDPSDSSDGESASASPLCDSSSSN